MCGSFSSASERMWRLASPLRFLEPVRGAISSRLSPARWVMSMIESRWRTSSEPMAAWNAYAIPAQPAAVLLDRSGRERGRWLGAFDTAEVLAAARAL
jgi:hypothetical protein